MKYTFKNGNSISIEALAQSCCLSVEEVKTALVDLDCNNFKNPNAIYIASIIREFENEQKC